ncbi:hypothetical protein STSO111631_09440 [Stackebrandtia soli]
MTAPGRNSHQNHTVRVLDPLWHSISWRAETGSFEGWVNAHDQRNRLFV